MFSEIYDKQLSQYKTMFLQQPLRIILGPSTHVLHLVWSARDLAAYQHDKDSSRKLLELSSPPVTLFFHSSKTKGNWILKDYHATSCSLVWFAVNYFTYCMGCQTQLWYGPMREHEALALWLQSLSCMFPHGPDPNLIPVREVGW